MKNTSFEVPIVPPAMRELINQWENEGYTVLRTFVATQRGEADAIRALLDDIAEDEPQYKPLETATAANGIKFFVAAKCKLKE